MTSRRPTKVEQFAIEAKLNLIQEPRCMTGYSKASRC